MGYALQMTWQASLLSQKRKSGPPLGLKNLGNTCYLNSVLQCLTYTPPLAHFCLKFLHSSSCDTTKVSVAEKKNECPFCIVEKRIARSLSIEAALDSPTKINNCLKIFAEHFRYGRQEDAHEFLRYVIDACHNTCLRIKKLQKRRKGGVVENGNGNGHTVVKEIFGGALQSQVKCLSCGAESNKVDEIMDISLDVLHSGSLKEALQRFFQPEVLDGNNKYKCENCKKLVVARKQMSILQAPNVLAIQLKRFEGIFGGKIDKPIGFDDILVLSNYMCRASQDLHPEYNLFATIVHSGVSADSGHYYAYIKDAMGRWYCCNDSFISLSTLQEVLSEKVYILFFSRTKQRPALSKAGLAANGTKSHEANGNLSSEFSRTGCLGKPVVTEQFSDHRSQIVNSMTCKANKAPSSPLKKLTISENSNFERPPAAAGNIRILDHKRGSLEKNGHLVHTETKEETIRSVVDRSGVCKNDSGDAIDAGINKSSSLANGNGKMHSTTTDTLVGCICEDKERSKIVPASSPKKNGHLVHTEAKEKTICSVVDRSGVSKNESGDATNAGMKKSSSLANGNGKMHSTTTNNLVDRLCEDKERSKIVPASSPKQELANGGVRCSSDKSGLKRKFQDEKRCILLAKDAASRAEVEEFKEIIGKEAYLFLRSCGWSDKVYNFMQSKKKLCAEGAGGYVSNGHELKRLLMADAKSTFISQIPESLKGSLIERLKSFSQEEQSSIT